MRITKTSCSYFEFSDNSVLIHNVLVVIIAAFPPEQVKTVQPVLKVVKITLQFLWVHLKKIIKTAIHFFYMFFSEWPLNSGWHFTMNENCFRLRHRHRVPYLQLIQLRLLLLEHIWHLLLLAFSSLGAFYRRVIRFDIWVQVSSEDGVKKGGAGVGEWRNRALETWILHESCQKPAVTEYDKHTSELYTIEVYSSVGILGGVTKTSRQAAMFSKVKISSQLFPFIIIHNEVIKCSILHLHTWDIYIYKPKLNACRQTALSVLFDDFSHWQLSW